MTARPRDRAPRDDHGMTLVELLVAASISSVILTLVLGILVGAQRQTATTAGTADAVDSARTAVATMARQVRLGSGPISVSTSGGVDAFGFATGYGPDGSPTTPARCVQYRVFNEVLQTRSFTTPPPGGSGWSAVTTVGTRVTTAPASSSVFSVVPNAPAAVRVRLSVQRGSSRTVVIDSALGARNPASTATGCGTFS